MGQTAMYDNILESMSSGIVATDADGIVNYINPKALRLLDLNPAGVINLDIRHLLPETGKLINECLQAGSVHHGLLYGQS